MRHKLKLLREDADVLRQPVSEGVSFYLLLADKPLLIHELRLRVILVELHEMTATQKVYPAVSGIVGSRLFVLYPQSGKGRTHSAALSADLTAHKLVCVLEILLRSLVEIILKAVERRDCDL